MPKLNKCFPEWYLANNGAIFKTLAGLIDATTTFPWLQYAALLDMEYIGNHSGEKTVSPLIDKFIEQNANLTNPYELTENERVALASILKTKFLNKWTRLYAIESAEYNPIENYSMVEEETPDISRKHSVSNNYADLETRVINKDITRTETATNDFEITDERKVKTDMTVETDTETNADIYAFNSNSPTPTTDAAGNSTVHTTGADTNNKETNTHNQTGGMQTRETANGNNNTETLTRTQTGYTEDTESGTRTLTRSGNIGVTTSQQMIQSEIELWQWNFFESVYADVDSVLTTQIYD